ncbi:LuxR C-terminal-related transcriptional regulator [Leifsonia sp. YIM 134122]|uniref:LuxR C-terminal-related transcriptional regulator n=1 Tax=Leifsonia stereocauli TaxID=3134136 RepID=A0ABU9W1Q1_9MICO
MVDRPLLKRRLDAALTVPLTLLVAPPGAGKTVLLDQWAADHPELAFVRIDLDSLDDDPVRFARRLSTAMTTVHPDMAQLSRFAALSAGGLGGPLLAALSAELESFPETVVILDDLHHLSNAILLADLGRFIAALPMNVHVVMSTRVDPAIPWSGLRLRNHLLEIRQDALAMTREETAELLTKITNNVTSPAVLDVLVSRTEGWAAGVQLAGITLKYHDRPDEFVAEFGGSDRLVAEYLTEEVLDALPPNGRALLLRMSPLDTMTADLVNHVLGREDAQRLFEQLRHESMFFVPIDNRQERFRFHHLFRDLLRYRLRAERADEEAVILGRAAEYHLNRGEFDAGVEYLLRARDWDGAIDAIMTRGSDIFERGEMRTVIRWLTTVPETARAHRLDVALELGILLGMQGAAARTIDILGRVAEDSRASVGERAIAYAWMSATVQWNPRPEDSIRAGRRALSLLDEHPHASIPNVMRLSSRGLLSTIATASVGRAHFLNGDMAQADAWLSRALDTEGVAYPPFRVGLLGSLALLHAWCGRASEAERLAVQALDVAAVTGLVLHPISADAHLALAMVAVDRGLEDASAAHLQAGELRAEANHRTQLAWLALYQRAQLAAGDGRLEQTPDPADRSTPGPVSSPAPALRDRLMAIHMNGLRRTGRAAEALHSVGDPIPTTPAICFETIAAHLSLGDTTTAAGILDAVAGVIASDGLRGEIQLLLLRAWAAEAEDAHDEALEFMAEALDRAEPERLVAPFTADGGPVVLRLIDELAVDRVGLAQVIMTRARRLDSGNTNAKLADPLTERELEVLRYLPDRTTNAEIAELCFVTVNTLKTHMAHIYRKLGVTGRSAAIDQARQLGLLDPVSARADQVRVTLR